MIIHLKKKKILKVGDFSFKCSIGKKGISKNKSEGDKKTPKGTFNLHHLYYRKDRINLPLNTKIKKIVIKKDMGWCDDINSKKYNKLININEKYKHERMYRRDNKYDLLIPIKFNFKKPKKNLGSCIFIHLTKNYLPTAGCVALQKKDFLILLKLVNKNSKIVIH